MLSSLFILFPSSLSLTFLLAFVLRAFHTLNNVTDYLGIPENVTRWERKWNIIHHLDCHCALVTEGQHVFNNTGTSSDMLHIFTVSQVVLVIQQLFGNFMEKFMLVSFYIFLIVNDYHEKTKTDNASVRL